MTEYAPYSYHPSAFVPSGAARPLRTRAVVATIALMLVTVSAAATAAGTWFASQIVDDAVVRGEGLDEAQTMATRSLVAAGLLNVGSLLFAGIAFISWLHRARKNLDECGVPELRWTPGGTPRRTFFILWASLWTAFPLLDRVSAMATRGEPEGVVAVALAALGLAVEVGAALSAILLVRRVTSLQEQIMQGTSPFSQQAGPWAAPVAPPVPYPDPTAGGSTPR